MEHKTVAEIAFKINPIAAKGNASGSTIKLATPRPCPAEPTAKPLVTGSVMPIPVKILLAYVPPRIPLRTIALRSEMRQGKDRVEIRRLIALTFNLTESSKQI